MTHQARPVMIMKNQQSRLRTLSSTAHADTFCASHPAESSLNTDDYKKRELQISVAASDFPIVI